MFSSGMIGLGGWIAYFGILFLLMWLIMIRPQRKREQQANDMINAVKNGDTVLLNSGIYGKVVDIINDNFIIEIGLNKGIRIPVKRSAVVGVQAPNLTISKAATVVEEDYDDYDDYEDDEE